MKQRKKLKVKAAAVIKARERKKVRRLHVKIFSDSSKSDMK